MMLDPAATLELARLKELGPHHRKSSSPCDNNGLSPIAAQRIVGGSLPKKGLVYLENLVAETRPPPENPEQKVTRFAVYLSLGSR